MILTKAVGIMNKWNTVSAKELRELDSEESLARAFGISVENWLLLEKYRNAHELYIPPYICGRDSNDCKVCPTCGFDNLHIIEVHMNIGGIQVVINSEGIFQSVSTIIGRGVEIRIKYHCENEHVWYEVENFYKGSVISTLLKEPDMPNWMSKDIWRD
jgi:hypothetical protein